MAAPWLEQVVLSHARIVVTYEDARLDIDHLAAHPARHCAYGYTLPLDARASLSSLHTRKPVTDPGTP